ncbi:MAG: hypothetical protein QOE45_2467 [Frankiaceae bacterium]|nr:hypothetical protein [Frankiaceae bacterium]
MAVVVVFAVLAFAVGLVVLALLAVRVFRQVKALTRTVAAAGRRVGDATAALDAVAPRER